MEIVPSVIGGGAVIVAAVVAFFGVLYGHLTTRLNALEDDLRDANAYNREMWAYCRRLLDLYYRYRRPNSPDPPPLPDEPA